MDNIEIPEEFELSHTFDGPHTTQKPYPVQIELLRKWSEIAAIYHVLHERAYQMYQFQNTMFSVPVIILSTLSGTISFSIGSFPVSFQAYMPMLIGGVNLFVGILQTISEYLKINNLSNSHRIAAIQYDKFSRDIITELTLPEGERPHTMTEYVLLCKKEMDKMIEQSPNLPGSYIRGMKGLLPYQNTVDVNDILKHKYKKSLEHTFEQMNPGFRGGGGGQLKPGVMGVLKKTAGFYKKELEVKPVDNVAETVDDVGISVMEMGEDSTKEVEEE